jgi:20S proteasome subunit beta 6
MISQSSLVTLESQQAMKFYPEITAKFFHCEFLYTPTVNALAYRYLRLSRTDKTVLTAAGCISDIITLNKVLGARLTEYEHNQGIKMSTSAVAQLLSVTLYYRRFFPYYAFCMVAGLDENGKGAVYGYDAVGSYKRDEYGCMGSGQNFIMPLLDNLVSDISISNYVFMNLMDFIIIIFLYILYFFPLYDQVGHRHRLDEKKPLTQEEAVSIVKELFIVATERDIYTGDNVEIKVIRADGIQTEVFPLKKD